MRRVVLAITFLLLIAGLFLLWSDRFELVPDAPSLNLADLREISPRLPPGAEWLGSGDQPALRLRYAPEQRRAAVCIGLPGFPAVAALRVRFSMAASKLTCGRELWEDGRALIEWRSSDGHASEETDPVCSLRDDQTSGDITLVLRPSSGSAIPVLRVEHLGTAGDFTISKFEITPVKESATWKYGRWGLLVGWFVWLVMLLAGWNRWSLWRRMAAVAICLGIAVYFAVPGPWKTLRPLVIPFQIGPSITLTTPVAKQVPDQRSAAPSMASDEVLGKIPLQGSWIMQVKDQLAKLRLFLHVFLLFVPTLGMALLVGRKSAIALAIGLAVSIEAAQTGFGFGFDMLDVLDLACDAVGIALAMWVYRKFAHCQPMLDQAQSASSPRSATAAWRSPLWIMVVAALVLASYLSPRPFWIDATDCAVAVAEGRPVVHPPGSIGFLYLANLIHRLIDSPYRSLQLISAGCYLASIAGVFAALKRHTTLAAAGALTLAYAFNWVCLNIATTGTSHASDLLLGSILVYLASLPRPTRSSCGWHPALFLTLVWAASFRMSSVMMAGPFLLLVLLRDYRLPQFWISAVVGGVLLGLLIWISAQCYGGWDAYRAASAALHADNARSGFLTGGGWQTGGMNILRAGWWLLLALPLLPLLALVRSRRMPCAIAPEWSLFLPAALAGGVLFVVFGYLCVHPGYLAPALPALFVLLARFLQPSRMLVGACLAQLALALALFFIPQPVLPPRTASEAATNAFFLQFTARAHRDAVSTLSLSSWLYLAGRSDLVPPHRRARVEADLRSSAEEKPESR